MPWLLFVSLNPCYNIIINEKAGDFIAIVFYGFKD